MSYQSGPRSAQITKHFEGPPRLVSRVCEGGEYEVGWGSTYKPDGSFVVEGETCTHEQAEDYFLHCHCLLYTSPSPRDQRGSRMPSSA